MVDQSVIHNLPLSSLPSRTLDILSSLNSPKVIPSNGVAKLPRDWTGLAFLVNISSDIESDIKQYADQTAKVLEIWQNNEESATVRDLLKHLEVLDRYDVYDDIIDDLKEAFRTGEISVNEYNQIASSSNNYNEIRAVPDRYPITYDNRADFKHVYDAIVLFAEEDKFFVAELSRRLDEDGFQVCTVDDLLASQTTQCAPVAQLISDRCRRIILVFSPEFLHSIGMNFYNDYAQARSLESGAPDKKILPIMYRVCQLPTDLRCYHKLFYQSNVRPVYDFWHQLRVEMTRTFTTPQRHQQSNGSVPPQISIDDIAENQSRSNSRDSQETPLLGEYSSSMSALDSLSINGTTRSEDSMSLSNVSQTSSTSDTRRKKRSVFSKLVLPFSRKNKRDLLDSD